MKCLKTLMLAVLLVISVGCMARTQIQTDLNRQSYSLAYLHDTKQEEGGMGDKKICLTSFQDKSDGFKGRTEVSQTESSFWPLLVFWYWNYQYESVLGRNGIQGEVDEFVKRSFLEESSRSGRFKIVEQQEPCDYDLTVSIDSHVTKGPYAMRGHVFFALFFWTMGVHETAGPAVSQVKLGVKLNKGTSVALEKAFLGERIMAPLTQRYSDASLLRKEFANSMVESLSYAFKQAIEDAVKEISKVL